MPPAFLPKVIAAISPFLPTRHYGEVVGPPRTERPSRDLLGVALGFTLVFGLTAVLGYRRDESRRYR